MRVKLTYIDKTVRVVESIEGVAPRISATAQLKKTELTKQKGLFKRTTEGVVGLGKSILGFGLACSKTIRERRSVCQGCHYRNRGNCMECGCIIKHKTRVASESCPVGFWGSVGVCNNDGKRTKRSGGCGCVKK